MEITREKPGVFRCSGAVKLIDPSVKLLLENEIAVSPHARARLCLHDSDESPVHEMIICLGRESYIRPHKHLSKSESLHLIAGVVSVLFFSETGVCTAVNRLAPAEAQGSFCYRIEAGVFHSLVVESETVLIHEVIQGPLCASDSIFAPWAPAERASRLDFLKERLKGERG